MKRLIVTRNPPSALNTFSLERVVCDSSVRTILSVNCNHDGSAAIISDGEIVAYTNTERFSRLKKHTCVRDLEVASLLTQAGIGVNDIDLVLMLNFETMDSPEIAARHGTNLQQTWFSFTLDRSRSEIDMLGRRIPCIINLDHFLCHASCAYYFSPFETAMCFAYDPCGSGAFIGIGNQLHRVDTKASYIGAVYDAVSLHLGFGGVFGAGKLMGLSPYGKHENIATRNILKGALELEATERGYRAALHMLKSLSDADAIFVEEGDHRWNATMAYNTQMLLEMTLSRQLRLLQRAVNPSKFSPNLCLSGGTALNSVANQTCFAGSEFERLYLHPASGDDGTAIGGALYYWHHVLGRPKRERSNRSAMYSLISYDGQNNKAIEMCGRAGTVVETGDYVRETAKLLSQGKIIGWYQGASEIGPRALGNRSILCDARDATMKRKLNARVKWREMFRPFAPSVLNEHAVDWFGEKDSPFMLRVFPVLRRCVPAITHVDGSARIQTVARQDNPEFYDLIESYRRITGVPLLLNTSLNTRGDPIAETPEDAAKCFISTDIDCMVFPQTIIKKHKYT